MPEPVGRASHPQRVSQDELLTIVAELARTSPEWERKKYPDWRDRLAMDLYDCRRDRQRLLEALRDAITRCACCAPTLNCYDCHVAKHLRAEFEPAPSEPTPGAQLSAAQPPESAPPEKR